MPLGCDPNWHTSWSSTTGVNSSPRAKLEGVSTASVGGVFTIRGPRDDRHTDYPQTRSGSATFLSDPLLLTNAGVLNVLHDLHAWGVERLGSGKILVGVEVSKSIRLIRLSPAGSLDRSFGNGRGSILVAKIVPNSVSDVQVGVADKRLKVFVHGRKNGQRTFAVFSRKLASVRTAGLSSPSESSGTSQASPIPLKSPSA